MKEELLRERLEEARSTYKLNLGYCNIERLPDDFVALVKKHNPRIIELDLTSNQISELPDDLHELTHLQALRVKYNRLEFVPPVCFKIQRLVTLDLAGNHIEAVPDDIVRLSALRELDVSGNHITSLTGGLDQLPHLTALHLENNQLKTLPESIGFCVGLVKLKCSTNLLHSLPSTMGNLKKIQRLDFANNLIHSVPPVMGHLKALKEFTLRYNPLESAYQQATDEGLSKFLAFLKKEEAREEAETRERLRPIGTQVGHFCEFRCKPLQPGAKPGAPAAPIIEQGDIDHKPWTRAGATLCKQSDTFYLFGGVVTKTGRKTAELYVISTDTMEWRRQETTGDSIPVARSDHCAVIDPETNRLIIFGGRSQEKKRMNDVWALDLSSFKWFKQACQGAAPRPRDKASAAVCAGVMVIFGGHTQGKRLNDLCVLDLSSFSWSSWTSVMGQPSPREAAALCVGHGNLLFLHGGASNFGLDDLYDQKQQAWLEVITEGLKPPARRSHTIYVNGNTMYIFGGIDELGAPSTAMFKADVEYGTNFSNSRLQWQELISDRAFNPNRLMVFDSMPAADKRSNTAKMHCFQLGSRTLGAAITEDVDKGVVYFDVYAIADVSALAVKPVDTEAAVQKHGKRLRVDHSMNRIAKLPRSFTVTSLAEAAAAKFLAEYGRAYTELYRHRRPLYLLPLNECGVAKFVCTTIRPTKLPFPDLWSLDGAVSFVANAIEYEPVENPLHPPEHLLSPQSVLAFQAGDSFDLACLLVSILTGCGFDAYVTVGYAPSDVVQNDQTKQICPLLEKEARQVASAESAGKGTDTDTTKSKFRVKGETTFESEFQTSMQLQESELQAKKAEAAKLEADTEAATARERYLDSLKLAKDPSRRLLHAWVLVKAGARGVTQDTFIETASGRQYSPSDCPYTGIEWCWNYDNFWISMDMPEPHSDARLHPARADFDFSDSNKWEAVVPPLPELPPLPVDADSVAADAEGGDLNATVATTGGGTTGVQAATGRTITPTQGTGRSTGAAGFGKGGTNRDAGDFGMGDTDGAGAQVTVTRDICATVEMPESWVPRLSVPRDVLDMRVPKGTKKTIYQYSELEVFALFGESAKFDGCLQRLSIYEDLEHQIKLEDREYFGRRKDKLYEKRRFYSSGMLKTFVEHFGPGAAYGVKELWQFFETNAAGESILTRQVSEFYVKARIDCLAHKEEIVGVKLIETYCGREDGLVYRSGTYGPAPSADDAALDKPQPLVKTTEKFQRNVSVSAQSDVARRVFYLSQDAIRVDYHVPEDRITHSYRVYTKTGHSHIVQSDPMLDQVDSMTQLEQFQELLAAEKECSMGIRQSDWENREFAKVRKLLNEAIVLETPYYDITRVNADEDDDEEAAIQEVAFDYLSPFMPNIAGTRGLTRDEALVVREACLKALKERLIERANIIQVRHDEEVTSLGKRRANFQRDRDQLAKEAEAEYEEECERSTFKIQILEKRLKHHEEQAICKYYELDHKLRRDPRLAACLQS